MINKKKKKIFIYLSIIFINFVMWDEIIIFIFILEKVFKFFFFFKLNAFLC